MIACNPSTHWHRGRYGFRRENNHLERFVSPIHPQGGPVPVENIQFQTIGPLRFESGIWHDDSGKEMLAVEATNIAASPILGFVFTESFFDPATGNRHRRVTTKELETHGDSTHYHLPGATWAAGARKFSYVSEGLLPITRLPWTWLFSPTALCLAQSSLGSRTRYWACSSAPIPPIPQVEEPSNRSKRSNRTTG